MRTCVPYAALALALPAYLAGAPRGAGVFIIVGLLLQLLAAPRLPRRALLLVIGAALATAAALLALGAT